MASATQAKQNGNGAIEGEVVEAGAVEVYREPPAPAPVSLFRTDDPIEVIERATKVANALKSVIVQQNLYKRINGRDHVLVEGWTTLGSMLGVVPVVAWSRRVEPVTKYDVEVIHYEWVESGGRKAKRESGRSQYTVEGYDWEARVEARTMDGRTVGGAEAMCSRNEHTWAKREDYALRSMAQTRAVSKALRGPLGFIVALAGYATTPAEEMPAEPDYVASDNPSAKPPEPECALPAVVTKKLLAAIKASGKPHDWVRTQLVALGVANVPEGPVMRSTIEALTERQVDELVAICEQVTPAAKPKPAPRRRASATTSTRSKS